MTNVKPRGCGFLTGVEARPFAPEDFLPDEKLMIETAEAFSRNEVLPKLDQLEKQEEGLMPGLIRKAGDLGFCGPDTPEAYGGLGLSKNLAARILEYLSLNGSFSVTIGVTSGISQVGISLFGDEEQKRKYLPRLASGEWIGAYALSEPDSGSDALSLSTRATRHGDSYRLTGTKMWISNAKWADLFLVLAKVDGERITAFLLERDFPGVSVAREEHKMGLKGSSTARLVLDEAVVPAENLLYIEGKGHHVALNALNLGRFKLASMSLGPARDAIGLAASYTTERRQFGQPLAHFGLIQRKLAVMASLFFAAESMTYRTGALIDEVFRESGGGIDGNLTAAPEFAVEASIGKVFASEAESLIVDEALQCFGGYGFTEEFPIARHFRDARVSRIYEGTNEINRVFSAGRVLKKVADGALTGPLLKDSFIGELLDKAIQTRPEHQIALGGVADLLALYYAEQSSRLRANERFGLAEELHRCFLPWAQIRAAEAYQIVTGNGVAVPAAAPADTSALAQAVIAANGPLGG